MFERQTIEVAPGNQLLFTANRRGAGFQATNGEIVTVDRFDGHDQICLADGPVVPHDYVHLAHGYAITAYRSQGKSADEVAAALFLSGGSDILGGRRNRWCVSERALSVERRWRR